MTEPRRIIEAEVVRDETPGQPQRVETHRAGQIGPMRFVSRGVYVSGGGIDAAALGRARLRLAVAALVSLAGAVGAGWLAATTQIVLLAALMLVMSALLALAALLFGALWRLMGRLAPPL